MSFVKGFESATNMFSPVAHDDDGDSMKNKFSAALLFQASLGLCKDVTNHLFYQVLDHSCNNDTML